MFLSKNLSGCNNFATFYAALPINEGDKLAAVSKLFDVTQITLKRWLSGAHRPPRAAVIALFFESPYGRSAVSTKATEGEALAIRFGSSIKAENARLQATIAALRLDLDAAKLAGARPRDIAMNEPRFVTA